MKKFKALLLVAILVVSPMVLSAQGAEGKTGNWAGYTTNRFADNWFVSLGAAGIVLDGSHDNLGDFGKRISIAPELAIGKWVTPIVGLRFEGNAAFKMNGFSNSAKQEYVVNSSSPYKKEWKEANFYGDILLNVSNWIGGYRSDRTWEFVPFAGMGWYHVWNPKTHNAFGVTAGLLNKIRFTDVIGLNLQYRLDVFDGKFTREPNITKRAGMMHSVSLGLVFNINNIPFVKGGHGHNHGGGACDSYRWY